METKLSRQAGQKCRSGSTRRNQRKARVLLGAVDHYFRMSTDNTKITSAIARSRRRTLRRRKML
jgi:hypothetical protein